MNKPPLPKLRGLKSAAALFLAALAAAVVPPPPMNVNGWAAAERVVSPESGSPLPGRWNDRLVPYLRELQDCLSPDHPCRTVTAKKSAQTAFTEAGLNFFASSVDEDPCPFLILLPTLDEAKKYNRIKLQPTIDATPALARKVADVKSRDSDSSTALFKQFARGYAVITGANASSGLQMISARKRIYEEVSEYPADAGGRGDPVEQAETRGAAWGPYKPKSYYVSTPSQKGACRISTLYEASDQRRYYVECPHCRHRQVLRFDNLRWSSATRPHGAYFVCSANGCIIDPSHKRAMIDGGLWIKTYPPSPKAMAGMSGQEDNPAPPESFPPEQLEQWRARAIAGRDPGFHLWQAYSPFFSWDDIVAKWLGAQGDTLRLKVFTQQVLGEEWEEKGEAPAAEKLVTARERLTWRRVPEGALFITDYVDVQGDRLEYGVYAWSRGLQHGWHIDGGIFEGNPTSDAVWRGIEELLARTYEDARGKAWDIDALGIDSGFLSSQVYRWAWRHALPRQAVEPHNPPSTRHVFACDGRAGWRLPALGMPSKKDIDFAGKKVGAIKLWPVGTFDLKAEVYAGLDNLLKGQDDAGRWRETPVLHFSEHCDLPFFEQMTAEHLIEQVTRGITSKIWGNPNRKRNEQLDIAVGARALAHHLADTLTDAQWLDLAARRSLPPALAQGDLGALWAPGLAPSIPAPAPVASPAKPPRQRGVRGQVEI